MTLARPLDCLVPGLFLPGPSIPIGWRWAHYIDPIKHVITALVPPQFYEEGCTPSVDCPRITTFDAASNSFATVDTFDYVQVRRGRAGTLAPGEEGSRQYAATSGNVVTMSHHHLP